MSELVTLAQAKSYLQIDYDDEDTPLQVWLDAVEERVARFCQCKFGVATYVDRLDGGGKYLWPDARPIVSVSEITDWSAGVEYTGDVSADDCKIYRDDESAWPEGERKWQVTYRAGYTLATAPAGLKLAIMQLLARVYEVRDGRKQESSVGFGTAWGSIMESDIYDMIHPYILGGFVA